jgi:hypothetical protein
MPTAYRHLMDVRVLGALVVVTDRGEVAVPGVRLRTLLMLLVAHVGRT